MYFSCKSTGKMNKNVKELTANAAAVSIVLNRPNIAATIIAGYRTSPTVGKVPKLAASINVSYFVFCGIIY